MIHRSLICAPVRGALLGLLLGACVACAAERAGPPPEAFPDDRLQDRVADIHVFRNETELVFTNTTRENFGPGTLWINAQYARPLAGLAIGQTVRLQLGQFQNEYAEQFRAGGFFAIELPDTVVQVQLQTPEELIGFVVVAPPE